MFTWLICFFSIGVSSGVIPKKVYIKPYYVQDETDPRTFFKGVKQVEIEGDLLYLRTTNGGRILVFQKDRTYSHSIGSKGQGPGEFRHGIKGFAVYKSNVLAFESGTKASLFHGSHYVRDIPLQGVQFSIDHLGSNAFAMDDSIFILHSHPRTRKLGLVYSSNGKVIKGVGDIFPIKEEILLKNPAYNDTIWVKGDDGWFAAFEYHPLILKFDKSLEKVGEFTFNSAVLEEWEERWGDFESEGRFSFPCELITDLKYHNGDLWAMCYGALLKIDSQKGNLLGEWHFFGKGSGFNTANRLCLYAFDFFSDDQVVLNSQTDIWGTELWTAEVREWRFR